MPGIEEEWESNKGHRELVCLDTSQSIWRPLETSPEALGASGGNWRHPLEALWKQLHTSPGGSRSIWRSIWRCPWEALWVIPGGLGKQWLNMVDVVNLPL